MKKKILTIVLMCTIFSITGCAGCGGSFFNKNYDSDSSADRTETGNINSSNTSQETTEQELTESSKLQRPEILQIAEPVDENGILSYIPNTEIEENIMQEISIFQNQLLSSSFSYDKETNTEILCLKLLSFDSGELLYETEFQIAGSYTTAVQVCENQIVVCDAQGGIIHVFDNKLTEIKTYKVSGNNIYVNTAVTEAYCFTYTEGLQIVDLVSRKKQGILENTSELTVVGRSENCISIGYIDLASADKKECYAGLNLETGELERLEIDDSFSGMEYNEGIWTGQLPAADDWYFLGTQKDPYKFQVSASYPAVSLVGNSTRLVITTNESDGSQNMTVYDTDGTFLSACSLHNIAGTLWSKPVWLEAAEGYFFILIDDTGHDQLYFWDLSKEVNGSNLEMVSYYEEETPGGEVLEQKYYERAKALSEKYGATVKIADQCSTEYTDQTALQECDPEKVEAGLDVLERVFSSYPDGFFGQLYYGAYRKMEINLMGELTYKEEIEGHTASAFVQTVNGKITMVLNINFDADTLEQTFYHESSHIIDQVLAHDALYRKNAIYSEEKWQSLNPEEFVRLNPETGGYYDSYEIMPMEYFQEIFTPCFISDYGKSFSTEDRATVFETAMTGDAVRFSSQTSPVLYEKLEYYCKCIRDCFDTTGWPEYTTWEETLLNAG